MSVLSVSTIESSNSTSDLTIRASNTSGAEIVLYANGEIKLETVGIVAGGNTGTAGQFLSSNGTAVVWAEAPAGSSFNTKINQQVGFLTSTDLTAAFTAPSTADRRYIIHSIHATNISSDTNDLYMEIEGTEYPNTVISGNIPLPARTSLEFLKKPKILYPNDLIKARSTSNNAIHLLIVYETSTDTGLFGKGFRPALAGTDYDAFVATGNSIIESLQLTNYSSSNTILIDVSVRTVWVDSSNAVQGYFTYDMSIPVNSTVEVLSGPKVLPAGHKVQIQAGLSDRADIIVSGKLV